MVVMSGEDHHDPAVHEEAVARANTYRRTFFPDAEECLRTDRRAVLTGIGTTAAGSTLFSSIAGADGGGGAGSDDSQASTIGGFAGEPRGVHASFTEDPTSTVTLTWFTDGRRDPGTVVEFGNGGDLDDRTTGRAAELPFVEALVHRATITELEPGATVTYRVGGDSGFSDTHTVTIDDGSRFFSMTFTGDQGVKDSGLATRDRALALDPDLHLVIGDVSYADGDSPVWDLYFGQQESLFATTPTMNQVGNHEFKDGADAADYKARHSHPDSGEIAERHCYSFRYGNVHFSGIDNSGSVLSNGRLQDVLRWVEHDLATARLARARGEIQYIVVFMHHPIYTNQAKRSTNPLYQVLLEPALHRHDVDLVLVGHDHIYERSYPMAYGVPTTTVRSPYTTHRVGFVHLQNGVGGQSLRRVRPEHQRSRWSATAADDAYAVSQMNVVETYGLDIRTVTADEGRLVDEFFMNPQYYEEPIEGLPTDVATEVAAVEAAVVDAGQQLQEFAAATGRDASYFESFEPTAFREVPGFEDLARRLMTIGDAHPARVFRAADIDPEGVDIPEGLMAPRRELLAELLP
jgi:3',5'-cyclic AMP phosphodiesterase CpdA